MSNLKNLLFFSTFFLTTFYGLNAQWAPVGSGFFGGFDDNPSLQRNTDIYGMIEYQDNLYAWGDFDSVDGIAARNFARYDGTQWHALPFTGYATDMEVFQGELYIAAYTGLNSPLPNRQITKWDGLNWSALDPVDYVIVDDLSEDRIEDLQVYKNHLYMGGTYFNIGQLGQAIDSGRFNHYGLARWNGAAYDSIPVGNGFQGFSRIHMSVYNDSLLMTSESPGNVDTLTWKKWYFFDGGNWHHVYSNWVGCEDCNAVQYGSYLFRAPGVIHSDTGNVFFLFSSGPPSDDILIYKDKIISIRNGGNGVLTDTIIQVTDTLLNYTFLGTSILEGHDEIEAIAIYRDTLYAAGNFDDADGQLMNGIMKWQGNLDNIVLSQEKIQPTMEYFTVYPNPFSNDFTLRSKQKLGDIEIQLFHILGQEVEYQLLKQSEYEMRVRPLNAPPGLLMIRNILNNNIQNLKIIKQ